MQRWQCLIAVLSSACTALPFPLHDVPAKAAQPKTITVAPSSQPASSTISPPPPPSAAPRVGRPAGHLDVASLSGLSGWATPQVNDPRALYDRSASAPGPLVEGGVMVCSVRVTGHGYDDGFFAGGPDVYMTLRIGEGAERGTHQTSRRIYSFPIARLEEGDEVRVRVLDDDTFNDDLIGEGHASYAGSAMHISTAGAEVSCRVAHGRAVERERARLLRRISRELDRMEGTEPDVAAYDLAYPTERAAGVRSAMTDALAWMQPFDEELQDRVDRASLVEERWEAAARGAVDTAIEELPPVGEPVTLGRTGVVRADALVCGAEAMHLRETHADVFEPSAGCLLRVEITTRRGGTLPPAGPGALEVWGLDRSASMLPAAVVGRRHGTEWVALDRRADPISFGPGETLVYVLAFPAGTQPALLRVGRDRRATVIRVE